MIEKRLINIRVSDDESDILSAYCEEFGQTQTDVVRAFIRSLEGRIRKVRPATVEPSMLPSLPLSRKEKLPPVAVVYFVLKEAGDILYVGHAANLNIRFANHPVTSRALEIDEHARVHWLERHGGEKVRLNFERGCIKRFNPPLNTREK